MLAARCHENYQLFPFNKLAKIILKSFITVNRLLLSFTKLLNGFRNTISAAEALRIPFFDKPVTLSAFHMSKICARTCILF